MIDQPFQGFSRETIDFFKHLKENNNKTWFNQNRTIYESHVLGPAKAFVIEVGTRLQQISPAIVAEPRIDRSIFRLHRDTRFSKDKSAYKTHLGIFFWEGTSKKIENPGFYFQLDTEGIFLGAGLHMFTPAQVKAFRKRVVSEPAGSELRKIMEEVSAQNPEFKVGEVGYKRIPAGFPADHPNSKYLLHKGLAFYYRHPISDIIFSPKLSDFVFEKFKAMAPLHTWLVDMVQAMNKNN